MSNIKKAIILAAGEGRRLRPYTNNLPKTLIKIEKLSFLERIVESLHYINIEEIVIVAGYAYNKFSKYLINMNKHYENLSFELIYNPYYATKNNIYSFWMANKVMDEDFLLINSDVLFHPKIVELCLMDNHRSVLIIDEDKTLSDEEMKVVMTETKIIKDISKRIPPHIADGEYIGIAKFSNKLSKHILLKIDQLLKENKHNLYYEDAINLLLNKNNDLYGCSTKKLPWIEVDTIQDYNKAKRDIFPKIQKCYEIKRN